MGSELHCSVLSKLPFTSYVILDKLLFWRIFIQWHLAPGLLMRIGELILRLSTENVCVWHKADNQRLLLLLPLNTWGTETQKVYLLKIR